MSDDYNIETQPGHIYWAPLPSGPVRTRWERFRLWWWQKRTDSKGWVPLGYTYSEDDLT